MYTSNSFLTAALRVYQIPPDLVSCMGVNAIFNVIGSPRHIFSLLRVRDINARKPARKAHVHLRIIIYIYIYMYIYIPLVTYL